MGGAWVKRWSPGGKGHSRSLVGALRVHPAQSLNSLDWTLPPSKSHAIRLMALSAQAEQTVTLTGMTNAGDDAISMRRCLSQMGVQFDDLDVHGNILVPTLNADFLPHELATAWRIHGVGPNGFKHPVSVLHAGNSGTALRILMALSTRFNRPVMLDGDASLRARPHDSMTNTMAELGVSCSFGHLEEGLPLLAEGPWKKTESMAIDVSTSSQPATSWMLASPASPVPIEVVYQGNPVSKRHAQLTLRLCKEFGAPFGDDLPERFEPWTPQPQHKEIAVPKDMSLASFGFLAAKVLNIPIIFDEMPSHEEGLGHEILLERADTLGFTLDGNTIQSNTEGQNVRLDLCDSNDLITPVAAMMALGAGGQIVGAAHAAFKESNRITKTLELLQQFGLKCTTQDDGLDVPGNQTLSTPQSLVLTHDDHRLQMTALVLALGCNDAVTIQGDTLHGVADPQAVARFVDAGVPIESFLYQPE
jgi:3-phosphoshikimate 1-carboxyvinyltransferase